MQKPKHFIAISTESQNGKLVLINTSCGESLLNLDGITFDKAIDFLFSLIKYRHEDRTTVFVCYQFARDNEFIFATMPRHLKDKLFQSAPVAKQISELELESEALHDTLYEKQFLDPEFQRADFERLVNYYALRDLIEVKHNGYEIKLANGKSLIIRGRGKVITFYDIFGFFKPKSLKEAVKIWLDKDLAGLDHVLLNSLESLSKTESLKLHSFLVAGATAKLATKLNHELERQGLNLSRYQGVTALSSLWLGSHYLNAKSEYHNYRFRRQLSPELHKAVRQSNYGGRAEQFKIGTLKDVYVYDINSAYAHACTFLPRMLRKPYFVETWNASPFSIWFCDYDFTDINPYFGFLPNRDVSNATKYKLKGRGYFWQPEIQFILNNYPNNCEIQGGFVLDYEQAEFAKGIETLYQLRLELQRQKNPLEKVFKLALASMYGKFCQHNGKSHYYNLFYAGFITSFTRMQLLEATKGHEQETITFQTDAIHSLSDNLVCDTLNGDMGGYKREHYDTVTYLDNGVYRAANSSGLDTKNKSKGFASFEFEKALAQIKDCQTYNAVVKFFITHNIHTQKMFRSAPYLSQYEVDKEMNPLTRERSAMRLFEVLDIDLTTDYFNSKPLRTFSGLESGVYRQNRFNELGGAVIL